MMSSGHWNYICLEAKVSTQKLNTSVNSSTLSPVCPDIFACFVCFCFATTTQHNVIFSLTSFSLLLIEWLVDLYYNTSCLHPDHHHHHHHHHQWRLNVSVSQPKLARYHFLEFAKSRTIKTSCSAVQTWSIFDINDALRDRITKSDATRPAKMN